MKQENAIIDKVRKYIAKCPYLKEYAELNVEYLQDKVNTYSINENAGYDPIINKFFVGAEMQFLFTFDSKLAWNEDIQNNIDNSKFFEKFRDWLEDNNSKGKYPKIEGIEPLTIGAITNGFIYATNSDEAIYRISCSFTYEKEGKI